MGHRPVLTFPTLAASFRRHHLQPEGSRHRHERLLKLMTILATLPLLLRSTRHHLCLTEASPPVHLVPFRQQLCLPACSRATNLLSSLHPHHNPPWFINPSFPRHLGHHYLHPRHQATLPVASSSRRPHKMTSFMHTDSSGHCSATWRLQLHHTNS